LINTLRLLVVAVVVVIVDAGVDIDGDVVVV
jgi:hypothetical protein